MKFPYEKISYSVKYNKKEYYDLECLNFNTLSIKYPQRWVNFQLAWNIEASIHGHFPVSSTTLVRIS